MGLMQKIRKSESADAFSSRPTTPALAENSLPNLTPCLTCHGSIFWESIYRDSVYRCEACEPAPSSRMIGRRLSCGYGQDHQPPGGTSAAADDGGGRSTLADDSPEALATRLASNLASGNCTGNDWADSRRRGRLMELIEVRRVHAATGEIHEAIGYPKFVNQRFSMSNPLTK